MAASSIADPMAYSSAVDDYKTLVAGSGTTTTQGFGGLANIKYGMTGTSQSYTASQVMQNR